VARDAGAEVRDVLRRQRAQLDGLTEDAQRKIAALLEDTQRDLERELRRYQDSAPDSFTAQDYRVAMARVRTIAQGLEDRLAVREAGPGGKGLLVDFGERARGLGLDHLEEQITRFSAVFEGTTRPVNLRAVARTLDEVLLERFETSVRSYGFDGVKAIQRELAQAQLAGRFPRQHADRVMEVTGFGERERWKADRIVRTELAHSYSAAHLEGLRAANEADPGYRKKLVATRDDRVGSDSIFVDGQVRELDEPFEDNEGRVYQHPPNRPNDREVEVATRAEWEDEASGSEAGEGTLVKDEDPAGTAAVYGDARENHREAFEAAKSYAERVGAGFDVDGAPGTGEYVTPFSRGKAPASGGIRVGDPPDISTVAHETVHLRFFEREGFPKYHDFRRGATTEARIESARRLLLNDAEAYRAELVLADRLLADQAELAETKRRILQLGERRMREVAVQLKLDAQHVDEAVAVLRGDGEPVDRLAEDVIEMLLGRQ
jgi:hypothetical protein